MKVSFVVCALVLSAYALPNVENLTSRQNKPDSLLIDPKGLSKLPSAEEAKAAAAEADLDLDNIQGDILAGMKKNNQLFFFFKINDKATFKSSLKQIHPMVTNTNQLLASQDGSGTALNVAFSQSGLNALDVTDDLGDQQFKDGQFANLGALGDPGSTNWANAFKDTQNRIHGVFLLAAATEEGLSSLKSNITSLLGASASELYSLKAAARPGDQLGHEHFGFLDGISQPGVIGFTKDFLPGQTVTPAGVFLLGEDQDPVQTRPAWAKDGSFLAFRQLKQLVPEFDDFVNQNALNVPGLTAQENADLFGARIVGRWKSGAPIDLAPLRDDPALGADRTRNNNFTFAHPGKVISTDQTSCPFSAHIRKTRPRADFGSDDLFNQILRSGIPYGPEVTDEENQQKKSSDSPNLERGLAFVSYQSRIASGFQFLQQTWANSPSFFHGTGIDPLIGSANGVDSLGDTPRPVSGLDPQDPSRVVTIMKDFVVSRGGEYFFSPSLSAILDPIAA